MTREEKIRLIKKFRPSLYIQLNKEVPNLVLAPTNASKAEINIYNDLICEEAETEENNTFRQKFSF